MTARDVMKQISVLSPQAPVAEAARLMKENGVEVVPIGEPDSLQGIVTPREIVFSAVAELCKVETTPVEEIATPVIGFCREDQELGDVLASMDKCGQSQLLVQSLEGEIIGCVSREDIIANDVPPGDVAP